MHPPYSYIPSELEAGILLGRYRLWTLPQPVRLLYHSPGQGGIMMEQAFQDGEYSREKHG